LLQCDVIDTGIGIDAEQLQQLFNPFTQLDRSLLRKHSGTGLGLALCQRLAEALGGSIAVTSMLGRGSTFRLVIPTGSLEGIPMLDCSLSGTDILAEKELHDIEPIKSVSLRGRILLAEDGPDNQAIIARILKKAGAEVVIAENGREAIEKNHQSESEGRPFDLILMDMQMPVLDGCSATKILRAEGFDLPIIAFTANATENDRNECLAAGCDSFITKPFKRESLVALLAENLEKFSRDGVCVARFQD
jgi:CheY-like chemotaxis protein